MTSIVLSLLMAAATTAADDGTTTMLLFDFRQADSARPWAPINDVVMGGVSSGRLVETGDGAVAFEGTVSLDNNGGFASVRSDSRPLDLRGHAGLLLRVRGDGKRYKINLKNDRSFDGVLYRAVFGTAPGAWQTVRLPFDEFVPTYRGRVLRDAAPLDLARVMSFGLMISDKQAGPFRLELQSIEAYPD